MNAKPNHRDDWVTRDRLKFEGEEPVIDDVIGVRPTVAVYPPLWVSFIEDPPPYSSGAPVI
jgi:hypothetical protein